MVRALCVRATQARWTYLTIGCARREAAVGAACKAGDGRCCYADLNDAVRQTVAVHLNLPKPGEPQSGAACSCRRSQRSR